MDIHSILTEKFKLSAQHVANIVALIDEGNTIPFIARYRKEQTGSCDDQVLRELSERLSYLRGLEKRKAEVCAAIAAQDKLTEDIERPIEQAVTLAEVEDIYRPFRPKRRTRATIARERGLEPLADLIEAQNLKQGDIDALCAPYIDAEREVPDTEAALAGALDIIAERISDDAMLRGQLRALCQRQARLCSLAATEEDTVYRLYYDFAEPISKLPSHRILAINRGEREGALKVRIDLDEEAALALVYRRALRLGSITTHYVEAAATDSYRRLIFPSLEREVRADLTERAIEQAIRMFGLNLRPLIMQPPIKGKVVMGFDPAYRTGCKLAVVDPTGKVLDTALIYPTKPHNKIEESKKILRRLVERHGVEVIAIGNGTASKESEIFVAQTLGELDSPVQYATVSEAGASVYSASKLGAEEFPDFDVSLRSAVSIARRLQDPMAELVKIDPKAIGVGQYQHDMPAAQLDETLSGVVESCVNSVGVDLNTASPSLLGYVAGLTASTAKNLCLYREENGAFTSRTQLKKVKGLGPKTFEQCAGFLRIPGAVRTLDNTAVHPESYAAVERLLELFGYSESDLTEGGLSELPEAVKARGEAEVSEACGIGLPTLRDILSELMRPGRDIRDSLPPPVLRADVLDMKDLKAGMDFMGTVRNVVDFGAFVDIGVHQDGLVHISAMADRFIKHPSEVVAVGDVVKVWVQEVDVPKKRISLTMKAPK